MTDAELVREFIAARDERRTHRPPSETRRLSLAEAYDLQDRLREALVARGERVAGWKVGFTSKAAQAAFQATEPAGAFLLASGVLPTGAEVPLARFTRLVLEAEVAFVMRHDLAGPGVTLAQALTAVEGALPALELVDFRYSGKPAATDVVAEGVYASAVVLGAALVPVAHVD
ncbi:MAG TPA: 4-oxalocrotonate decarboxylase, partial [Methylomirabilota bacterium]|nr:4-oxalocrotonate decarboxylase [Methylomirabilota bacterium]